MESIPKVCVIVLNWNGWKDTIMCLESVFRNTYPNYQVVVIDNGSTGDSVGYIKRWAEGEQEVLTPELSHPLYHLSHPPIKKPIPYIEYSRQIAEQGGISEKEENNPLILIQTGANLGFAGGNNVGLRYALAKGDCDYVWLLNNDAVMDKNALRYLVEKAENEKYLGVVGSVWLHYDKPDVVQLIGGGKVAPWMGIVKSFGEDGKDKKEYNKKVILDYIGGASFLIRSEVLKKVGLMDENYFLYWEETDWCERIKRAYWRLDYEQKSIIYHKLSSTTGLKSKLQDYYMTRNAIIFIRKHYSRFLPCASLISTLGKIVNRIKKRQFDRIGLILKATLDGLKYPIRG